MKEMDNDQLAGVLESLVFVSGDPVPVKRLADTLDLPEERVREGLDHLAETLVEAGRGIQLMEVAGGFQLRTRPTYSSYVNSFLERKKTFTLSGPALETLAIIAYKQPITRAEIEAIRGVGVDGVLKSLLDKRFVKVTGVKEVPGRPNLYGTTRRFLEHFGINSLKDLPPVENLEETFSSGVGAEESAPENGGAPEENADPQTETNHEETPNQTAGIDSESGDDGAEIKSDSAQ